MSSLAYLEKCKSQRMSYPDRAAVAKEVGLVFRVYVPMAERQQGIAKGSGIVGVEDDGHGGHRLLVYYEGDLYRADKRPYPDLVYHAADRMATAYPTVARALVRADSLLQVGTFDYAHGRLVITDQVALDAWLA